jgi:hypothetical protein
MYVEHGLILFLTTFLVKDDARRDTVDVRNPGRASASGVSHIQFSRDYGMNVVLLHLGHGGSVSLSSFSLTSDPQLLQT